MAARLASPLIRAALFVRDLDRAKRFYTDVLGFDQVYYEGALDHPAAARLVGAAAGDVIRCSIIRGEGPDFGMVGLFEVTPSPPDLPRPCAGAAAGETCLVFYVGDLTAAMARAEALGAQVVCPPILLEMPHASQREASLRDPDGVLVNLIERDPDQAFAPRPWADAPKQ